MQAEIESRARSAALRAYELGRMRVAAIRAVSASLVVGVVGAVVVSRSAVAWLPLVLAVVFFTEWRGSALARGARRGTIAGVVSLLMPVALLRPCCVPGMDMSSANCCASSTTCLAAGAAFGLVAALFVPNGANRWSAVLGMTLAVTAIGAVRCAPLFVGESLGLLAGLVGGVLVAGAARASWAASRR